MKLKSLYTQLGLFLLSLTLTVTLFAAPERPCDALLSKSYMTGGEFLAQRQQDLILSPKVQAAVQDFELANKISLNRASEKIAAWLKHLDSVIKNSDVNPLALENLKQDFYNSNLVKFDDIPESYFESQARMALERGHGAISLTLKDRKQIAETLIADQKASLGQWLDYLLSSDTTGIYPIWMKYWTLTELTKLGKFNPEQGTFSGRPLGTVAPFAELNREAYALVVDLIVKHLNKESLPEAADPVLVSQLKKKTFSNMYGRALQLTALNEADLQWVDGQWIKYKKGSSHRPLHLSLQGRATGWCTAGEETARSQLKTGDFYVYYTKDSSGEYKQPRIAIRMEGDAIAEVRGIAKEQNLDKQIAATDVLDKKLAEFGAAGDEYRKKSADMKTLTLIADKTNQGLELTQGELRFLYQLESKIEGFGYEKDPRIQEVLDQRNFREDIGKIYNVDARLVTNAKEDILNGTASYFYGDFKYESNRDVFNRRLKASDDLSRSRLVAIIGNADFTYLTDASVLSQLTTITGDANFYSLKNTKGLKHLQHVGGYMIAVDLQDEQISGLSSLSYIGGEAHFNSLSNFKWVQVGRKGYFAQK